ncbi:hypothetical protein VPH35_024610 [Triticum aestivum]
MEDVSRVAPRRRRQKKKARAAAAAATLPDDVVLEILARVADDAPALFRCAVSCKRWRALVADPSFLRRRWPEGAGDPGNLLGFCHDPLVYRSTAFVPVPRSPLGPRRRSLGSFFPNADGLFGDAVPLASRSSLLLVRLRARRHHRTERVLVRLAVCNPLAGTWNELPPLHGASSMLCEDKCAIVTDADHPRKGRRPSPIHTTLLFKVIIIMAGHDWRPYSMYTFSSAESRWSTPRRCFQRLDYDFVQYGNPVVSPGKARWLIRDDSPSICTLEFCIQTGRVSITQFPIPSGFTKISSNHAPILSVGIDGNLSLICLHKDFLRLQICSIRQGEEGCGNGLADVLHTKVVELKHKPPQTTKPLSMYVGGKGATLLVTDRQGFTCAVNLETGTIDEVTGMSGNYELQTVVPFEIDWPAFFMSCLDAH